MLSSSMTKIARRGLARLMRGPLAHLMLFGHLVLDEHEAGVSCEICQHARQAKVSIAPPAQSFFCLLVFFVGVHAVAGQIPCAPNVRRYAVRAPPQ